ncbi:MAG TPA: hypothetical protein VIJ51_07015 [Solirubrobacteraceae bacterium]
MADGKRTPARRLTGQLDVLSDDERRRIAEGSDEQRATVRTLLRERLSAEDLELRDRAAASTGQMVLMLVTAAANYNAMCVLNKDFTGAQGLLEMIAERWRDAEELELELFGSDFLKDEEAALLGALEDSLVLSWSDDEDSRSLRLDPREVRCRVQTVCQELPYADAWNDDWDRVARDAKASLRARGDWHDGVDEYIDRIAQEMKLHGPALAGKLRRFRPGRLAARLLPGLPSRVATVQELLESLVGSSDDTLKWYRALAPNGRALTPVEERTTRDLLERGARWLREADDERDGLSEFAGAVLRLRSSLDHSVHRSLILALSDDPARRFRAMTWDEVARRVRRMQGQLVALRASSSSP